ncbi:MAG: two-component system LytT family response regulator [Crocinitomix sp.]|jgi:two-component system LytT family response regulator
MKVVIIEDQVQLRKSLVFQIHQADLGFKVVGEADGVTSGIGTIIKHKPDIVFFDIEIIEGSSFEILDALPLINFKSVFATAHGHFAIKAIKYSAFDFLVKPYKTSELHDTLLKLKQEIGQKDDYKEKFELLFNELKGRKNKKIAISSLDEVKYIPIHEILRIEADRSYCKIVLKDNQKILSSRNMKHYESLLPDSIFIKVHRSHVINLNFIKSIIKTDGGFVKLINNDEIPLSRRKKEDFLRIIEDKLAN